MIDKTSANWQHLSPFLKFWFMMNYLDTRPTRKTAVRIEIICHVTGFLFCCFGIVSEPALVGGLIMLATAYFLYFLKWQGDKYGIWFDDISDNELDTQH